MTCSCSDFARRARQKQADRKVHAKGRFGYDDEGNQLCTVDSFGFRSRFDGECELCWQAQIAGYNKTSGLDEDGEGFYDSH